MIVVRAARSGAEYLTCDACPDFRALTGDEGQRRDDTGWWAARHRHDDEPTKKASKR